MTWRAFATNDRATSDVLLSNTAVPGRNAASIAFWPFDMSRRSPFASQMKAPISSSDVSVGSISNHGSTFAPVPIKGLVCEVWPVTLQPGEDIGSVVRIGQVRVTRLALDPGATVGPDRLHVLAEHPANLTGSGLEHRGIEQRLDAASAPHSGGCERLPRLRRVNGARTVSTRRRRCCAGCSVPEQRDQLVTRGFGGVLTQ